MDRRTLLRWCLDGRFSWFLSRWLRKRDMPFIVSVQQIVQLQLQRRGGLYLQATRGRQRGSGRGVGAFRSSIEREKHPLKSGQRGEGPSTNGGSQKRARGR
jgi:hypothetical protein